MNDEQKTRQAVGLQYNEGEAPKVTVKGEGVIAEEIIALAQEVGIHIHQDPHLAQFLQTLEQGEEIPVELYTIIAEIIAFVYMLEGKYPEKWNNMHQKIVAEV
ncbi:EscU/YscU/HrcU family type III secretion system export apparatus switch protein [Shewanella gelidii]|uniref:Flagellar biosynthetic protein FlhB n=1 Tax=Shewanella gelidii TaxID=1642821 RepID=A0A917N5P1_9GAMM|nr:EscU/YscU/HrcU family type III secretion system export apparatus switch protein [Shewanella gelidii]MCL1096438.1 EscU/YscU/HrcU family type III secretion system export apparatus switch protein [Shewanella gelidii]GGI67406.1 hypothetical protein GCM10009332_00670 [Shewanella gelidii]